jgi:nitrite reductase (NADH) small subunit
MNTRNEPFDRSQHWQPLCSCRELVPDSGVVAWLNGVQIALFYLPGAKGQQLFAVDNRDPKSGANVIGRGIVGQLGNDLMIASPLYKQHFRLADGSCVEFPEQRLNVWPVRLNGEMVEIGERRG